MRHIGGKYVLRLLHKTNLVIGKILNELRSKKGNWKRKIKHFFSNIFDFLSSMKIFECEL